jgi:hypothetical protein
MTTAKSLGFKKGDFILTEAGFPGILISDINTGTPCAEVWGFEHEGGSVYADQIRKVSYDDFWSACEAYGHKGLQPFSDVSRRAIIEAMQAANPEVSK